MKPQLSLIIVAGPNASGKTTLVERNQDYLTANNFDIILPDKIFKYATSLTDRPAVTDEFIENATIAKKNILIETPFQNQPFNIPDSGNQKNGLRNFVIPDFTDKR